MPEKKIDTKRSIKVRGTEIVATDTHKQYREKLARIALDEMYQFVAVLDVHGTLLEVNRAALEGGGLTLPDVEGKPFWECFWWTVSTETQETLRGAIARAAQGEFIRYDVEVFGRASGEATIIIDFSMIPVKEETGKVVFIVPEGRDITEKKTYEQQIAQKNADLQALLERIRQLDEIKTQFFANVSHELRTPLALIIGPAERLMNSEVQMNGDLQRDTARVIVRNARMLLKHVNDLLDISKLEARKLKIELRETDVTELIRFVASHFDILANERRINFQLETGSSFISVVDPVKLQRVVMNLLSNAFKFVPPDGTIRCSLNVSQENFVLLVEDSGPGIKPELREVIFERFRQGDGGTNRQFAGTGLGLAIAHEFVEMHKGTIEVHDSKLGGAMFAVSLPRTLISSSVSGPESQLDRGTLDGLIEELRQPVPVNTVLPYEPMPVNRDIVLVVEDNPEMNRFITQALEQDYEVMSAFDGQQGLQMAITFKPALIVSDIMMPGVSGVQMIKELRKKPEMQSTPILLLSAKADEELKLELLEESAQDFITKPFSERDLKVRIRNLIAVRKSQEILQEAERTKRQAIEAINRELQSRSNQLSYLFEQTPSFMTVVRGPDHVFELANSAYYKLVGYREIIGKPVIEALPELKGQGYIEMLDSVLASGKAVIGTELPAMLQRDQAAVPEMRYVDFVYQPLFENEKAVGVFVEGHDVTEQVIARKQLMDNEVRLKEQSNWLEQQVEERTKALKELNHSLELSNEDLQQFAHVASHDLKEPIRKIKTFVIRLQDDYRHLLPEKGDIFLNKILTATDRVYSMIDGVLSYSTMTSEDQSSEMVDLNEVLKNIETDLEVLINERKAKLIIKKLPTIEGAPVLLYQLFYNLVNNSIKFAKKTEPPVITVNHSIVNIEDQKFASIVLSDNGIGFDQQNAERIFSTFTRLNSKDRYEGTGLGLALCRKIAQRHGGSISAKGEKDKGAEFTVLLPLS